MVDWSKPLEAVHADGRIVPVEMTRGPYGDGWYDITPHLPNEYGVLGHWTFKRDGSHPWAQWTIRNVADKPAWRTSDEQIDRMDALLQKIAASKSVSIWERHQWWHEARAILAAREPVDPDIAIAAQICDRSPYDLTGLNEPRTATTNAQIREAVLAGIKYGRASAGA